MEKTVSENGDIAMEKELKSATQRLTVLRKGADGQDEEIPLEEDV